MTKNNKKNKRGEYEAIEARFHANSKKVQLTDFLADYVSYINQARSGEELLIYKKEDPFMWIFSLENNDLYEKNEFKDEYQNIKLIDFLDNPLQFLTIAEEENDIFVFEKENPVLELRSYYEREFE